MVDPYQSSLLPCVITQAAIAGQKPGLTTQLKQTIVRQDELG